MKFVFNLLLWTFLWLQIHLNRPNVRKEVEKDLFDEVGVDASFATAEKETMFEVFLWLKETYGSMDKYLDSAGVDAAMRKRIRETLGSKYMDIPNVTPSWLPLPLFIAVYLQTSYLS